jgi:hypothetical protein
MRDSDKLAIMLATAKRMLRDPGGCGEAGGVLRSLIAECETFQAAGLLGPRLTEARAHAGSLGPVIN